MAGWTAHHLWGCRRCQLYDLNSFSSGYTGLVGKDQVFGGIGNDTVHWNSVDTGDVADGGAGSDTLVIRFDFLGASTTLPVAFALGPVTGCYVSGIFGLSAAKFERVEIYASDGDDILSGGAPGDQLFGGKGSDTLSGLGGNDIISTGTGNFVASGGGGSDLLVLDLSNNFEAILLRLTNAMSVSTSLTVGSAMGFEALNVVSGSGDDRLTGGDLGDSLNGGAGDDVLFGGLRADQVITGGDDAVLTTLFAGGTSHVTDFDHARDTIGLAGFTNLLPYGTLDPARLLFGSFAAAPAATLAGPQFFHDPTTGNLWQDRNGTGAAPAVLVMVLDTNPLIGASDFVVADWFDNALI